MIVFLWTSAAWAPGKAANEGVETKLGVFVPIAGGENHCRTDTDVDMFADALGISRRTLSLRCRSLLDESPASAFSRYRIDKSADLLVHTDRSIKSISYELGFDNPFHFSRTFKRLMKVSPSAGVCGSSAVKSISRLPSRQLTSMVLPSLGSVVT